MEAALEEVFEEPIASKSTVSRICEDTRERYRQWCRRRLEAHDIVYLFLDAIYLKLRPDDEPAEGVLVCWGVTLEGRKILLGLARAAARATTWLAFGRDMIAVGCAPGARGRRRSTGIWKAVKELWPARWNNAAPSTRCGMSPQSSRAPPPGGQGPLVEGVRSGTLPGEATRELQSIIADYRTAYPSAMAVIERDLDALVTHLRFPSSTASGPGPRISWRERSWRSAGAPRSSAASRARPPPYHSSGRCWSSPAAAGAE